MASSVKKKRRRALKTESRLRVGMFYAIEIIFDILILLAIIKGFSWGYNFAYDVFNDDVKYAGITSEVTVTIKPEDNYKDVCAKLYDNDLIKDKYVMMAKMKLTSSTGNIIPGKYQLKASMSYDTILGIICIDREADDEGGSGTREAVDSSKTGGTGTENSDSEDSEDKDDENSENSEDSENSEGNEESDWEEDSDDSSYED